MNPPADRRSPLRLFTRTALVAGLALFGLVAVQTVFAAGENTATTVTSDGSPATYGNTVTFTATVVDTDTPGNTPTGTVEFFDGPTDLGPGTLDEVNGDDTATFVTSTLSPGSHSITADYAGDGVNFAASSGGTAQDITGGTTATALQSDNNPSVFGQTVTLSVNVSTTDGGTPTGDVQFEDTTTTTSLGDPDIDTSGNASVTVSSFSVATHHITATYSGDAFFGGGSDALDQMANKADTTTVIDTDLTADTIAGTSYNVMVTVTANGPGAGTPGGTVNVDDGTGNSCPITLGGGLGSCSMPSTTAGLKTITATYVASTDFNTSSDSTSHTVDQAPTTTGLGSDHNPSVHGQSVTLTASVAGNPTVGVPTGTVDFKDGATVVEAGAPLNGSGIATFTTSSLSTATHSITAVYSGDANYTGSASSIVNQVVNQASTSTTVVSSDPTPPGPDTFGTSVTFTAHVVATGAGSGTPTGTVDFKDGSSTIGSDTLDGTGHGSYTTSTLSVGSHTITAVYADDANFVTSTSALLTQTVTQATPTVAVSSGDNPSTYGDSVTFHALVTGTATTPTGTLTFKDGGTPIGSAQTLDGGGNASVTTSTLSGGTHVITAVYNGEDPDYTGATGTLSGGQEVDKAVLNVTADDQSRAYGQANPALTVHYDGFVNGENFGSSDLTGAPSCSTGATPSSSVAGSPYTITCTAGTLASSDYSFNFVDGSLTVTAATSATVVAADHNPSVFGQSVTFTATISGFGAGAATGTVDFIIDGGAPQAKAVSGDQATFTTSSLSVATHSVTANYSGDGNVDSSTGSLSGGQIVNQASTTTVVALTGGSEPSTFGDSVTFTATVAPVSPGAGTPTGTVQFKDDGSSLGAPVTLVLGQASLSTSALTVAIHSISAVYLDDSDFVGSTSVDLSHTVTKAVSATGVASDNNPSTYGDSVTLTATVTGGGSTPTGSVAFKDGGATLATKTLSGGVASYTTTALHGGSHAITAVYGGDSNYTGATGTLSGGQEVDKAVLNVTADDQSRAYGQANPALTVHYDGFVNGENFGSSDLTGAPSCSTGATPSSSVAGSPYTITCTAGTLASSDYSFNFVDGSLTVTAATSATVVAADHNPSVFGQSVTFTATISGFGAGAATGTVDFIIDGGAPQAKAVSGDQATFTTSSLSVATHSVTANYSGDGNVDSSTGSLSGGQVVHRAATTTSITTDLTPVTFVGGSYSVSATVTANAPGVGIPTGSVTVSDATDHCTITLGGGSGSCNLTSSTAGRPKTITATYGGDVDFAGSSDSAPHTVDTPPVAAADTYSTNENGFVPSNLTTTAVTGVLHNDTDADGDPLTAIKVGGPSHGTLTLNANGSFTYTPTATYNGADSFTYKANDGFTNSSVATVTLTVTAVNQPPSFALAASKNISGVSEDQYDSSAFSKANEIQPGSFSPGPANESGQTLAAYVVTNNNTTMFGAGAGQPAINATGTLTFETASNANGIATVTVRAQDSGLGTLPNENLSAAHTFTITVTPVNDAPTANGDVETVGQSSHANQFNVLSNDFAGPPDEQPGGANAQTIQIKTVGTPSHGTATAINGNTAIDYVPTPGFVCPASQPTNCDTFTYTIVDNGVPPLTSAPATVFITVTPSTFRIFGSNRYATDAAIVRGNYGDDSPAVYVATGTGFADALSGAAAASFQHAPLILVDGLASSIPSGTVTALDAVIGPDTQVVVLGGTGAINASIYNQLSSLAPIVSGIHNIKRLSDDTRYDTAVKVSQNTYPTPPASGAVFIATGLSFPDALAAAAVAGHLGAPLLLVPGTSPNLSSVPKVVAELHRLAPTHVYIAGGLGAVSAGIRSQIHTLTGVTPTVFAGINRYQTATLITDHFYTLTPVSTVYIATGLNFADALAGAALAGSQGAPLLLVPGTSPNLDGIVVGGHKIILDELGMSRLFPNRIIIFGGSAAVSTGIFNELAGIPRS